MGSSRRTYIRCDEGLFDEMHELRVRRDKERRITRAKLRVRCDKPKFVVTKDDLLKGMSYEFVATNHPCILW